jgi:hypothetical protein
VIAPTGPPWVNLATHPEHIEQVEFAMGSAIEVTFESPGGVLAAMGIFLVQAVFPRHDQGILLDCFMSVVLRAQQQMHL